MDAVPNEQLLNWATESVDVGGTVVAVESLHGGYSPWLLRIEYQGQIREVVLRAIAGERTVIPAQLATGAAALVVAEEHGLSAPRSIATDLHGKTAGAPATLETVVPGTSATPATVSTERLRAAGPRLPRCTRFR